MTQLYYFAYGSNLHPLRIGARIDNCQLAGTATLNAHQLRFHKRGEDGSAKCDAVYTSNADDLLPGAVFRLSPTAKRKLDDIEGLGYANRTIRLNLAGRYIDAFMYIADTSFVDSELCAFPWYRELVYLGARHHRFAPHYLQLILSQTVQPDPDAIRQQRQERLLQKIRGLG